jgi:hypothetical protein
MYHDDDDDDDDFIQLLVWKFLPILTFFKLNDGDRHDERIVMDTVFAIVN